jgi:hypothetical protein
MKRSCEPQTVLDQYRASLSPRGATRERVWDGLAQRAAAGEPPNLVPPPPPVVPVVPARLASSSALLAGALGAVALLIAGAWSWRSQHAPAAPAAPARALPGAAVVAAEQAPADPPPAAPQDSAPSGAAQPPRTASGASFPAATEHEVAPRAPASASSAALRASGHASRDGAASPSARATAAPNAVPGGAGGSFAGFDGAPNGRVPASERGANTGTGRAVPQLEEELRLLRAAYEALRADRPKRALSWLGEHATRFPHGALAETREVARIMALCQAGQREAARAEAAHFLQRSPHSPHAGRVRSLCAEASEPP